jgi:glutathione synthase/RimK-type ligase-like ATP-grasp enzyme
VPGLAQGEAEFVQDACERTCQCLSYLLSPFCFMVNEPSRMRLAEDKGIQLRLARQLGLAVPETLITNSPQRARAFCERFPEVVFKLINCPRVVEGDFISWIGTSLLTANDVAALDHLVASPGIFQRRIPKRCDLRLTIVGNQVFPVEIHSQVDSRTAVDFRRTWLDEVPLVHQIHALPPEVHQQCLALARGLGLATCAIDLVLTPEGEYVFLEVNPGGQWGWIEAATHLPITEALVDLFIEGSLQP